MLEKILFRLFTYPAILLGATIGKNSHISPGLELFNIRLKGLILKNDVAIGRNAWISILNPSARLVIGSGTNIGRYFIASLIKNITIGNKCLFSYNVSMLDHDHLVTNPNISPMDGQLTKGQSIKIGDNCFIGAHSFILKGVELGDHCVVAANSVVTKSFPKNSVIAGNPAKLIKTLT